MNALRWCLKTQTTRWMSRVKSSAYSTPLSPKLAKRERRSCDFWLSRLLLPNRWGWTWSWHFLLVFVISQAGRRSFLNSVDFKDAYLMNNMVTSLTRQLKMRRSLRGKLALRKRAQMTTRVGWRRWGCSGGFCNRRTETGGGRRERKQIVTLSCLKAKRTDKRKPLQWLRARWQVSHSSIRSDPGRSSGVSLTLPTSRKYRSMFLDESDG